MGNKVIIQPCTKSEEDPTAMIRIINYGNDPVVITDIETDVEDEKIESYLKNFDKIIILPGESFRFYFVGDDFVNPPKERFNMSYFVNGEIKYTQHISFRFLRNFMTVDSNGRTILNCTNNNVTNYRDPNHNAFKEYCKYWELKEDLINDFREIFGSVLSYIYEVFKENSKIEYKSLTKDELDSIIKDFMQFYKQYKTDK